MTTPDPDAAKKTSTAVRALAAAGDADQARDVAALDDVAAAAALRLGHARKGLVERLIYGPPPPVDELRSGAHMGRQAAAGGQPIVESAIDCIARGVAFEADGKLSAELRRRVAEVGAYGFTVPLEFGGKGRSHSELAAVEEELAAHGLGALAVEISGELTIGAGSLLGYGTEDQKSVFLPMVAEGRLMGFALTEVGIGVNAKKVQAYVERDEAAGGWRLYADGPRNKLWITNATHGGLVGLVARIGEGGEKVGLFVVELPEQDIEPGEADHEFSLRPSGCVAFGSNHNSRIHFRAFPIPERNRIEADGVEALFYCLRMGRCMLAAMSAGYQRMFAADAAHYARARQGVGGPVMRHELPRLALGTMLGGALQARAVSHLSLQQDADGVDLAGLRDLTKSAAATTALRSLTACERVLGGRTFDAKSRVSEARANVHVFGVVEGEDDLILMGMVRDVTATFTDRYMAGMLRVIRPINVDAKGEPLPRDQVVFRIGPNEIRRYPARCARATLRLLFNKGFWRLVGWTAKNAFRDLIRLSDRLVPAGLLPRYASLPRSLRSAARYAERKLRGRKWTYLGIHLWFQLELTRAQIPLQRFGKGIEHLVSMLVLCHHAAEQDESQQRVAALRCAQLKDEFRAIRVLSGLVEMDRTRALVRQVGDDVEQGRSTLLEGVEPEAYAHPWE